MKNKLGRKVTIHCRQCHTENVKFIDETEIYRKGLERALEIAIDHENGGDDGCHCASHIAEAIQKEIDDEK